MWSQTEDEDSDGPLTSEIHESVDNPAVRSPDASLGMHRSERADEARGSYDNSRGVLSRKETQWIQGVTQPICSAMWPQNRCWC